MKKILLSLFCISQVAFAQRSSSVEIGKPLIVNGLEYGFEITNESKKDIKDESFSRYEVVLYVANRGDCPRIIFPKRTALGGLEEGDDLATFDCLNATGKRLTPKTGNVKAKPFFVPYSQEVKGADGKTTTSTTDIQVGHWLRNGETATATLIFIVPPGEQPRIQVRPREINSF